MLAKLLFYMLAAHALCDFPLQGDFLAKGKNHRAPIPGVPFYCCLFAHAMIHAGALLLITGSYDVALLEFAAHVVIDFYKCEGKYGFGFDQILHIACKILWLLMLPHVG